MKVGYTTANGRLRFEDDVSTTKEAFELVAAVQEIFEEAACGLCGGPSLRFDVREFDGNSYYKLACNGCGATLDFGQKRDGQNLFIKRRDADGRPLPHGGWYWYRGNNTGGNSNAPAPRSNSTQQSRTAPAKAPSDTQPVPF